MFKFPSRCFFNKLKHFHFTDISLISSILSLHPEFVDVELVTNIQAIINIIIAISYCARLATSAVVQGSILTVSPQ